MKLVRLVALIFLLTGVFFCFKNLLDYLKEKEFVENSEAVVGTVTGIGIPNPTFPGEGRTLNLEYENTKGEMSETSITVINRSGSVSTKYKDGEIGDTKFVFQFLKDYKPSRVQPNYHRVSDFEKVEVEFSFSVMLLPIGISLLGLFVLIFTFHREFNNEQKGAIADG